MTVNRAGGKRTWIKLYSFNFLYVSIREELSSGERATWVDLLCWAGMSSVPGSICSGDMKPIPHKFIAHQFNIPISLLRRTLQKCIEQGRITEDEHGIHISNWEVYQSEYQRQKPSRTQAKENINKDDVDW